MAPKDLGPVFFRLAILTGYIRAAYPTTDWRFLSATICAAIAPYGKDFIDLTIVGDGFILIEYEDRKIVKEVSTSIGAPVYFNYFLSPTRVESYFTEFGKPKGTLKTTGLNAPVLPDAPLPDLFESHYYFERLPKAGVKSVAVFSDGAATFFDGQRFLPTDLVLYSLTSYKNRVGQAVQRRFQKFLRDEGKGFAHQDDFGMAALFIDEE
jgi:hypothetical protein